DDENKPSELHEIMYALPENHPAFVTYKKVCSGAADTIRSIVISANARLSYLQNPKILRILDTDDIDIPSLGKGVYENPERKVALFCVIPDNDKTYNFVVGMLYTQLFQELYYVADHDSSCDGRLPVPVALWMDEFPNVALPDGFLEILATCRSREISCNIIIQSLSQLKTLFKDSWESITDNCDTLVYLGGNGQSTPKYISELLGKTTIDKKASGETLGSHGSSSRNYDVLGRELLDPSEVRKIDNQKCLIFIRGLDPVYDDKYRTAQKDEFRLATKLGPYEHGKKQDLQDGRDIFYLRGNGDEVESLRYQIETYLGVFEESAAYKSAVKEGSRNQPGDKNPDGLMEGECLLSSAGYRYKNGCAFPVISLRPIPVKTGKGRLNKHPVVGAYYSGMVCRPGNPDELNEIFTQPNREIVAKL
ncbi:MAG: TraM recognition domain-containing protein, partial [Lachnospiraceae bacterium]|nr:TraM recognition domain-containing protein [Lachnospiraceae bacterium]